MHHSKYRASTEANRRAYQAGKNIIRLSNYNERRNDLENLKSQLSLSMINTYGTQAKSVDILEQAVDRGWEALNHGFTIERALELAEEHLQELSK